MASGADHYAVGELLLEAVARRTNALDPSSDDNVMMTVHGARTAMVMLAAAQAHFAAAQCAATLVAMDVTDWNAEPFGDK